MLRSPEIWSVIVNHAPRNQWLELHELYALVDKHVALEDEDFESDAPGSSGLRWHRNVRNVLQRRKTSGDIEWAPPGRYWLPG